MNPPQRGNAKRSARWTPFNYRRTTTVDRRPKPISVPITHPNLADHSDAASSGYNSSDSQPVVVRHIDTSPEQYPGWNLYFPEESMNE